MKRRLLVALGAALLALVVLVPAASARRAGFTARGSAEQVQVTGATPHSHLVLRRGSVRVGAARVGPLGGAIFRNVAPGPGYRVVQGTARSRSVRVLSDRPAPPSTKVYDQKLPDGGYGYLTTRDGTKLAINVRKPAGPGPFPTVVEYAGYGYARPGPDGPESGIAGTVLPLLGYAVVDVNMRGTGCSGGAFDYFERNQSLDGYDAIETVARQPWVLNHRPGMAGISYGGISQLFVGATRPPHLAALTPLSVIDDTATTLYPGGLLNSGFALSWAKDRVHDAKPASATGGQPWALDQIKAGDATCKANQDLHPEAVDLLSKLHRNRFYRPKVADPLAPVTFVHKISAPTFLACQFTDEQTGGHCPTLASRFTGTRKKWFTFTNGTHVDSLDPETFLRWYDFLELYVAKRKPVLPPAAGGLAGTLYTTLMGVSGVALPADPVEHQPTYAAAKALFDRQKRVRIRFDNGAGGPTPGGPVAGFAKSFSRFPLPGTKARTWYLGAHGRLSSAKGKRAGADHFTWKRTARPPTDFTGDTGAGDLWTADPSYDWTQNPPGSALSYITRPMARTTAVVGAGKLVAWIKSSRRALDLQATISEVRPNGQEVFVQNGWLRGTGRKLDRARSTALEPVLSLRKRDDKPLPRGRYTKIVVPLYYQGHVYRKGSRLRVTLAAPRGDQPVWAFGTIAPAHTGHVRLARSPHRPSRLVLPVVPGIRAPTGFPPCPGLRGEPCRRYTPLRNR